MYEKIICPKCQFEFKKWIHSLKTDKNKPSEVKKMARCPICGKNLSTTYGYRKHVDNCKLNKSIRDSDKILKSIKQRNKLK